jgi:hypothetical protein
MLEGDCSLRRTLLATTRSSRWSHATEVARSPGHIFPSVRDEMILPRHGRPSSAACDGHAARCDISIPNHEIERANMVLCLRLTILGHSWYSLTSTVIHQVECRSQDGFERLFDIPLRKIHCADTNKRQMSL